MSLPGPLLSWLPVAREILPPPSFSVVTHPSITLSPTSGSARGYCNGNWQRLRTSGYYWELHSLRINPVSSPTTCTVTNAGTLSTSFAVFGVAPGTYTVTVTAANAGDQASASFTVIGPTITLNPNSGPRGVSVSVSGSGFNTADTSCQISGTIVSGSPVGCAVNAISGGSLSPQGFTISLTADHPVLTALLLLATLRGILPRPRSQLLLMHLS